MPSSSTSSIKSNHSSDFHLSDSTEFITVLSPSHALQTSSIQSQQLDDYLLESVIEHPHHQSNLDPLPLDSRPTTPNLQLSATDPHYPNLLNYPPSSPTSHTPHPQLDLSCVNSDETDVSINSLFSFPDPLRSVDHMAQNTPSDQFHSDWFGRYEPTEFLSSLSSGHQSNFSSDHLDFKSSPSPSSNHPDLQSHHSLSSPNSPFIRLAGSDLSHRLNVHICGHPISELLHDQISYHLRLNFTQIHSLSLDRPTLPQYPSDQDWSWSAFTRSRLRKAISRALSNPTFSTTSPIAKHHLIHQTSWLEIVLKDLTCLSPKDQFSFLSALPVQPTLLIFATSPSDCLITKWLKELTLACPTQLHLFKILPVITDERKSLLSSFPQSCAEVFRWNFKSPADTNPPIANSELLTSELVFPGLLLQDSLDSIHHHILRPSELSLLSTSSVAKLHQLLIPFKALVKPIERNRSPTRSKAYPVVFCGCLITILVTFFLFRHQALGLQSLTQPIMRAVECTVHSAKEHISVTLDGLGLPLAASPISSVGYQRKITSPPSMGNAASDSSHPVSTKESRGKTNPLVNLAHHNLTMNSKPTRYPFENPASVSHSQNLRPNKAGVASCKQLEKNASDQVVEKEESFSRNEKGFKSRASESPNSNKNRGDHLWPFKLIPSTTGPSKSSPPKISSPCSSKANLNEMICIVEDYYHQSMFRDYFANHDPGMSLIRLNYNDFKLWPRHLPRRLKKSLNNLRNHPDLCIKKIRFIVSL